MKLRQLAIGGLAVVAAIASACATQAPGGGTPSYTEGPCPDGSGVTVVVDWFGLTDQQLVRCALGPQANGFDALEAIGLPVNLNEPNAEPGTVCTIAGQPTEGYPFCWTTGDGYWSYWRAPSTAGAWDFAPVGPSEGPLVEGTVEGWAWAPAYESEGPRLGPDGNPLP